MLNNYVNGISFPLALERNHSPLSLGVIQRRFKATVETFKI